MWDPAGGGQHAELVTFTDAVAGPDGSGISRLYGENHFPDASEHGQTTGTAAGQAAWDETQRYLTGAKGH